MKKDRIIQYRGWNVEYSVRVHWDSFGLAGYSIYEIEPDEESLSFGDLESALNYIDDEMDDREYDAKLKDIKMLAMNKEKYFIDLSKCSGDQQKHIFSLLPEPKNVIEYDVFEEYTLLNYDENINRWYVDSECSFNEKTELTYPDFIQLFEDGEGESQTFTKEDMEKAYRAGENKQTYYFKDTTVIIPTTYEGIDG